MNAGDVIAIRGKGILSDAIADLTGEVSHVGLVTGDGMVTQALSHGIVTISLAQTLADAKAGYCLSDPNLAEEDRGKLVAWALTKIGTPYAFNNLALELLDIIDRTEKWNIFLDSDKEEICSEFVALAYLSIGRDFGVSPRVCTPSQCLNYALSNGWGVESL